MSKPSKNETELMEWVGRAIWHHGDGREDAEAAIAGGEAMDDMHGGIFWVRADSGGLVSATPGEACDEIKRLRAENARLRETLENSAIMIQGCYDAPTNPDSLPQMLLHYIRAALEVKP